MPRSLLLLPFLLALAGGVQGQESRPAKPEKPAKPDKPDKPVQKIDALKKAADWGKQLRSGKLKARRAAGRELMLAAKAAPAAKYLKAALGDADRMVRYYACLALAEVDRKSATPAVTDLLKLLQTDPETQVRSAAATALGAIGPAAKAAVPELLLALTPGPGRGTLHMESIKALKRIGKVGVPGLNIALKAKHPVVRAGAAKVLATFRAASAPAVKNLIICLDDGDERVRPQAAIALGRIGPKAKPAIPGLTQALQDDKLRVRICVAAALGMLKQKPKRAVALLTEGLNSKDPVLRALTCEGLGALGKQASEFAPALDIALDDEDPRVQREAAQALSKIAPAKRRKTKAPKTKAPKTKAPKTKAPKTKAPKKTD